MNTAAETAGVVLESGDAGGSRMAPAAFKTAAGGGGGGGLEGRYWRLVPTSGRWWMVFKLS